MLKPSRWTMSFRLKTIIGVAVIETLLLAMIIWQSIMYLEDSTAEQLMDKARTTVNLSVSMTKDAVLSYDLASLDTFSDEIIENKGIFYLRIIDQNGDLLVQRGDKNYFSKTFIEDFNIHHVQDESLDVSSPIEVDGELYGYSQMGFSILEMKKQVTEARNHIAGIGIIEIILSAFFSLFLGTILTRRLKILKSSSEAISLGELSVQVDFKENDEIGQVGQAFDLMVRNLKHTREQREKTLTELELMNNELENRVMERTQKLLMTNNALNKEKSEQEKLIKELQSTREQLVQSEKMASIGQLSAGIAHEINNPVGFIISNLESLKDQVNDSIDIIEFAKQQADILPTDYQKQFSEKLTDKSYDFLKEDLIDIIEETMEGSQRVKRIVMDLKDYSHFGKHEKESYQINQGIESTLNIIKNQIKYNIDVECELGDIPEVSCCSSEINQVIMNLIVNASQAIEDKGNIIISSEFSNHEVLVKIKDNGCGISEEHLTKIFDPFFTTKPVGTGTGLGLSLSYSIMENNGGKLTVDSTVGVGTTFTLTLPVSDILS